LQTATAIGYALPAFSTTNQTANINPRMIQVITGVWRVGFSSEIGIIQSRLSGVRAFGRSGIA
jgi:hypothetical protein